MLRSDQRGVISPFLDGFGRGRIVGALTNITLGLASTSHPPAVTLTALQSSSHISIQIASSNLATLLNTDFSVPSNLACPNRVFSAAFCDVSEGAIRERPYNNSKTATP